MRRLIDILTNAARTLSVPVFNVLLSLLVIRYSGKITWGAFVEFMILLGLLQQFVNWGHRDYLLRSFSETPARINLLFYNNLLIRSLLLIPGGLFLLIYANSFTEALLLSAWLLLAFLYQSLDSLVVYQKKFTYQLWAEGTGMLVTLGGITMIKSTLTAELLLSWYVTGFLVKSLLLILLLRQHLSLPSGFRIQTSFFAAAFPFFLIGLSGMLQSKIDLYVVGLTSDASSLGTYQIIVNLFIYLQATSNFILTPFIRQLYRINKRSYQKIKRRFALFGLIVCLLGLPFIYVLLEQLYRIEVDSYYYLFGILMAFPIFLYLPYIYAFYKAGMEKKVMVINFAAAGMNGLLAFILLPLLELKGVLLAAALTQWMIAAVYFYLSPISIAHEAA